MKLKTEGISQLEGAVATPYSSQGSSDSWTFQWVEHADSEPLAQVTGLLRWRGFDLGFAVDGLLGVDGRLAAPGLATLQPGLQQVVLCHFAEECLQSFAAGSLADLALASIEWHEDPLPMQGEFGFAVRRSGVRGTTRGRVTVFHENGRLQLADALASLHWPLPAALDSVAGRLQVGTLRLTPDELVDIGVGDLVWIDDVELSPLGLRAHFQPEAGQAACSVWIKRSEMRLDPLQSVRPCDDRPLLIDVSGSENASIALLVKSPVLSVTRHWLQGAAPAQRLDKPALTRTWQVDCDGRLVFEGQLMVTGRRVGLRVTRILHGFAQERIG